MRHLAAYLLLVAGGNASPSAADVKALLSAGGVEADDERLNQLISELKDKDLNEIVASGKQLLAPISSGGAAAAPAAGGAAAAPAAAAPKEEKKKEEVVDALEGGMNMFGGGGGGGDY
jgi:large subunit ribosomal protein LP2